MREEKEFKKFNTDLEEEEEIIMKNIIESILRKK